MDQINYWGGSAPPPPHFLCPNETEMLVGGAKQQQQQQQQQKTQLETKTHAGLELLHFARFAVHFSHVTRVFSLP